MSEEVKLPPLEVTAADKWHGERLRDISDHDAVWSEYACRERQLREALAQIAALTTQVKELKADLKRGLNVEFQRTTCCVCGVYKHTPVRNDDLGGYICGGCLEKAYEKAKAELTALEEGATVTYFAKGCAWRSMHGYGTAKEATEGHPGHHSIIERTSITRERIVDITLSPSTEG